MKLPASLQAVIRYTYTKNEIGDWKRNLKYNVSEGNVIQQKCRTRRISGTTGPEHHRYIQSSVSPNPLPSLLPPSRGQGGHALNYQLSTGPPTKSNRNYEPVTRPEGPVSADSLPSSLYLLLSRSSSFSFPSHSKIYFVRACGWRTMRELGKCVTRLPALFIFARRNTPGHHAARCIPERSGLVREMRRYDWYFIAVRALLTRKAICRL